MSGLIVFDMAPSANLVRTYWVLGLAISNEQVPHFLGLVPALPGQAFVGQLFVGMSSYQGLENLVRPCCFILGLKQLSGDIQQNA